MENSRNPDHRFVDRVEETISVPTCPQFTRAELENWVDVSKDSVQTVDSSFRETAYLHNLSKGQGQNGDNGSIHTTIETQVTEQFHSSQTVNSSSNGQSEHSIDHKETILNSEGHQIESRSTKVKASNHSEKQTNVSTMSEKDQSQEESSSQVSRSQKSDIISEILAESNVQPFVTVDPNELLNQKSQSKHSFAWGDFHIRKQNPDSHDSEQFEKIFQEQLNAQKEKECKEQKIMDKLLGTIPAYRGDWKQTEAAEQGSIGMTSSEFRTDGLLVSGQERSVLLQGRASETNTSCLTQAQVTEVRSELGTSATDVDQSLDVKNFEKSVLSQGSVLDPSKIIEVERKFVVSEKSEEKLKELGAMLLSEKSFSDTYYDTSGYILTLSDCWLRLRGNKWELKTPIKGGQLGNACTQYNELTDEHEIVKELSDTLALDSGMSKIKIRELVHIGLLSEFCHLTTTRKSYGLKSCTVDLDVTNFGFRVGEIEVVILDQDRIPEALETIESVAKDLGLECQTFGQKPIGKIEAYLSSFNPHLYQSLVSMGVFQDPPLSNI